MKERMIKLNWRPTPNNTYLKKKKTKTTTIIDDFNYLFIYSNKIMISNKWVCFGENKIKKKIKPKNIIKESFIEINTYKDASGYLRENNN